MHSACQLNATKWPSKSITKVANCIQHGTKNETIGRLRLGLANSRCNKPSVILFVTLNYILEAPHCTQIVTLQFLLHISQHKKVTHVHLVNQAVRVPGELFFTKNFMKGLQSILLCVGCCIILLEICSYTLLSLSTHFK
jgi:hypothetical protein